MKFSSAKYNQAIDRAAQYFLSPLENEMGSLSLADIQSKYDSGEGLRFLLGNYYSPLKLAVSLPTGKYSSKEKILSAIHDRFVTFDERDLLYNLYGQKYTLDCCVLVNYYSDWFGFPSFYLTKECYHDLLISVFSTSQVPENIPVLEEFLLGLKHDIGDYYRDVSLCPWKKLKMSRGIAHSITVQDLHIPTFKLVHKNEEWLGMQRTDRSKRNIGLWLFSRTGYDSYSYLQSFVLENYLFRFYSLLQSFVLAGNPVCSLKIKGIDYTFTYFPCTSDLENTIEVTSSVRGNLINFPWKELVVKLACICS